MPRGASRSLTFWGRVPITAPALYGSDCVLYCTVLCCSVACAVQTLRTTRGPLWGWTVSTKQGNSGKIPEIATQEPGRICTMAQSAAHRKETGHSTAFGRSRKSLAELAKLDSTLTRHPLTIAALGCMNRPILLRQHVSIGASLTLTRRVCNRGTSALHPRVDASITLVIRYPYPQLRYADTNPRFDVS